MDTQEKAPGINATAKPDAKRKTSKGAEIMVDYLIKEKVPYLFGVCGHGNIGFLDAAANAADRIKTISLHHEQAAVAEIVAGRHPALVDLAPHEIAVAPFDREIDRRRRAFFLTGNFLEPFLQLIHHHQVALHSLDRLKRVCKSLNR